MSVEQAAGSRRRTGLGIGLALGSAAAFGTSGTFGTVLIDAGWSPTAVVLMRVSVAALILAVPAAFALRGHWRDLRRSSPTVLIYGTFAVAGAQVCYFQAIQRLSVGVALLLEYMGVIVVVGWMWLRHGRRPRRLTVAGSLLSVLGLVLVLDLWGGVHLDPIGVLWGLGAAFGLAAYFVMSARVDDAMPPVAMAASGLAVGGVILGVLGVTGVMPLVATFGSVTLGGVSVSWVVPMLGLAVVAAAFAYVIGIFAARELGATLASFVGLTEVVFAVLFAWLFLDQLPRPIQLIGGALIVAGVALVRIDELGRDRQESRQLAEIAG